MCARASCTRCKIGFSLFIICKCRSRNHARQKQNEPFYSPMQKWCQSTILRSNETQDDDINWIFFLQKIVSISHIRIYVCDVMFLNLNLISLISVNIIFHLCCSYRWRWHWSMAHPSRISLQSVCCSLSHTPRKYRRLSHFAFNVHKIQIILF